MAERLVLYLFKQNKEKIEEFSENLKNLKNLKSCAKCFNIAEEDLCEICKDKKREQNTIWVVEEPLDIISIERTGIYKGLYHVLGGLMGNHSQENDLKIPYIQDVCITPLLPDLYGQVATWFAAPAIKNNFVPPFPDSVQDLERYFSQPCREYFTIQYSNKPVGVIGADSIDERSRKLKMKKCIGNMDLQGRGIGKTATFLFLYYAFVVMNYDKVFIHSGDTNIRNIILNSKFGFELEGIFFSDVVVGTARKDVVRMGLLRPHWLEIFSGD